MFFWSDILSFLEITNEEVKFDYNEGLATKPLGKVLKTRDCY